KLVNGFHQADIAFLDQIQELQSPVGVFFRDRDHQSQVSFNQLSFGLTSLLFSDDDRLKRPFNFGWSNMVVVFNFRESFLSQQNSTLKFASIIKVETLAVDLLVAAIDIPLSFPNKFMDRANRVNQPLAGPLG